MKKNLIKSLKSLLKAYGGENSNKNNAVQIIDEITETLGGEATSKSKNLVEAIDKLSNQVSQSDSSDGIPFPELTVNLTIEDPEYVTEIDCAVYIKDGKRFEGFSRTYDQHDGRAPGQLVIEGGVVPCNAPQGLYIGAIYGIELSGIMVFSDSTHNYLLSVDNYVNMTAHENYDFYEITDVTKPASITVTANLIT